LLENKYQESFKKKKLAKRKRVHKPSKRDYESGTYHYIAFIPVDGQVWELDGLETKPLCLGKLISAPDPRHLFFSLVILPPPSPSLFTSGPLMTAYSPVYQLGQYTEETPDSWLNIASSTIQTRMARQDNEYLSFNLLAACQSPLVTISRDLATSLATFKALDDVVRGSESWDNVRPSPWEEKFTDEYLFPRFGLTRSHILAEFAPHSSFESQVSDASFNLAAAQRLADELRAEQDALDARYAAEVATIDEAVEMIRGRQRDYTPAIHQWVRTLAEKGILRELIHEMELASAP
jgi:ubiquitin carboxyl-terminal hydrolase L5